MLVWGNPGTEPDNKFSDVKFKKYVFNAEIFFFFLSFMEKIEKDGSINLLLECQNLTQTVCGNDRFLQMFLIIVNISSTLVYESKVESSSHIMQCILYLK